MVIVTGVATAQIIYTQQTYSPLPVPYGATNGIALSNNPKKKGEAKSIRSIICAGDSLVAGVGCVNEEAVFSRHIAKYIF